MVVRGQKQGESYYAKTLNTRHQHVIVYPVSGGKHINVVAIIHDSSKAGTQWKGSSNISVDQNELSSHFIGWEDELQAHICVCATQVIHLVHAMVPHQGAGAGTGIEDAYTLAPLFNHLANSSRPFSGYWISQIAGIYNLVRVPHAIAMSKASIQQGLSKTFQGPGFERFQEGDEVPRNLLDKLFCRVKWNWNWTTTNPDRECAIALEYLERQFGTKL